MNNNHNQENNNISKEQNSFYKEEIKKQNKSFNLCKRFFIYIGFPIFCLILGLAISFIYIYSKDVIIPKYANNSIIEKSKDDSYNNPINTSNDLIKTIIDNVKPSVVGISTLTNNKNPFGENILQKGNGSGVIFHKTSTDIFIITNYHVIENASMIGVSINNNNPVEAKLIGKDVNYDIAVLSVNTSNLSKDIINNIHVAIFANSSDVLVGDYVIAIGNALGEGIISTFGIISSTSTDIISQNKQLNVLQSTAAINPGNSGGALINLNGEVIGINTAKIADNTVERISYTIGTSVVMSIVEDIMSNLNPTSLGVLVTDLKSNTTNYEDIAGGAIVIEVVPNGSADKAGLRENDIITKINNLPILTSSQLVEEIKKYKVGDTIKLKIIRNGELMTIKVKFLPL